MNWSTTDGKSWTITIGEDQAVVWLIDETFYGAAILWSDKSTTSAGKYECLKNAKQACLESIRRVKAKEEADKPKSPVILRGKMYGAEHMECYETVKEAAEAGYWAIEWNHFMPYEIEAEGVIVWKNSLTSGENYLPLETLAGIKDSQP